MTPQFAPHAAECPFDEGARPSSCASESRGAGWLAALSSGHRPDSRVSAWERVDVLAVPTVQRERLDGEYVQGIARLGEWLHTSDGQVFVTNSSGPAAEQRRSERRERAFALQRAMRPLFPEAAPPSARTLARNPQALSPMFKCGWTRHRRGTGVEVRVDVNSRASFRGVNSCGRRTCPVCGPRLLARDAELIEAGVKDHGYERTLMSSQTTRHSSQDELEANRKGIVKAWAALQRHRAFKELLKRFDAEIFVRVLETTYSEANGWHVHYHVLVFTGSELTDEEKDTLERQWSQMWRSTVGSAMGWKHAPTVSRGVVLTRCYRADYLTKLGLGAEVTDVGQAKRGKKKGRSYWAIASDWLDAGADVASRDAQLLKDYVRSMRSAVIVAWPRKGKNARKRIDERHPEEKPAERETASMHDEEWDALRRVAGGCLEVLRAAERAPAGEVEMAVREALSELLRPKCEPPFT